MGSKGSLFKYADGVDKILMFFGVVGSIGDGLITPLVMVVLSGLIDSYGSEDISISNELVNKVCTHFQNELFPEKG